MVVRLSVLIALAFLGGGCNSPQPHTHHCRSHAIDSPGRVDTRAGGEEAYGSKNEAISSQGRGGIELRVVWVDSYPEYSPLRDFDMWKLHIGALLIDRRENPEDSRAEVLDAGGILLNHLTMRPRMAIQMRRIDAVEQSSTYLAPDKFERQKQAGVGVMGQLWNVGPRRRSIMQIEDDRYSVVGLAVTYLSEKPEEGVYELRFSPDYWGERSGGPAMIPSGHWHAFVATHDQPPGRVVDRLPWQAWADESEDDDAGG